MNGNLLDNARNGPVTQNTDSVKTLLTYMGRSSDPMPIFVELKGNVRLTRSKKGDCYYTTTSTDCSCKARTFNPGTPCKHMKALQAGNSVEASRAQAKAYQAKQRALREQAKGSSLPKPQEDSIRPIGDWVGPNGERANGPISA